MFPFGTAPTSLSTTSPPLKNRRVGIFLMPYWDAMSSQSSTLHLTTVALPSYSVAISSTVGDNILQGPHQVAQKSTITGSEALIISAKFAFVAITSIIIYIINPIQI